MSTLQFYTLELFQTSLNIALQYARRTALLETVRYRARRFRAISGASDLRSEFLV